MRVDRSVTSDQVPMSITYLEAIREAQARALAEDERVRGIDLVALLEQAADDRAVGALDGLSFVNGPRPVVLEEAEREVVRDTVLAPGLVSPVLIGPTPTPGGSRDGRAR